MVYLPYQILYWRRSEGRTCRKMGVSFQILLPLKHFFTQNNTSNLRIILPSMRVRANRCCCGKSVSITFSECVSVALVVQHVMRMRRIVCGLSGCTIFSPLSHKWHDFRRKSYKHKMPVLIFATTVIWNISHSNKNWARYYHKRLLSFM
jgi:hypothetical protein